MPTKAEHRDFVARRKYLSENFADVTLLVSLSVNEYAAGMSESDSPKATQRWRDLVKRQAAAFDAVVERIERLERRCHATENVVRDLIALSLPVDHDPLNARERGMAWLREHGGNDADES